MQQPGTQWRVGHGYDFHRLEPPPPAGHGRRTFLIAGIPVAKNIGPVAHSDGDALFHAVTDALLGAVALPDIGQLFPDTDPRWAGVDSGTLLREAVAMVRERGWVVENLDATVILERPKLSPHKGMMRANIAAALGVGIECVNVKGKTHEQLDAVGEGRGIEVHVVVLLRRDHSEGR